MMAKKPPPVLKGYFFFKVLLGNFKKRCRSQFGVKIFGKSGCERNCAQVDENCEERISHGEEGVQQKGEDSIRRIVTDGYKCYNKKKVLDYFSQRGQQFLAEQWRAVDSCPFHLVHPHFIRPWKTIQYTAACNFHSKKHIVLHDHTNRKWKLKLLKKTRGESYFGIPWFRFGKCHNLGEGDVLAFEFIKGEGRGHRTKIQVYIFCNG